MQARLQEGTTSSRCWARGHTLRSAPFPPRDPIRASATDGPRPGASAGCHFPHAVSVAATSTPACTPKDPNVKQQLPNWSASACSVASWKSPSGAYMSGPSSCGRVPRALKLFSWWPMPWLHTNPSHFFLTEAALAKSPNIARPSRAHTDLHLTRYSGKQSLDQQQQMEKSIKALQMDSALGADNKNTISRQ